MPPRAAITRSMRAGSAIPEGSGREAAREIDWYRGRRSRCSIPKAGVYGRWFRRWRRATPAGTRSTAMCQRGRAEQAALIYDLAARRQ